MNELKVARHEPRSVIVGPDPQRSHFHSLRPRGVLRQSLLAAAMSAATCGWLVWVAAPDPALAADGYEAGEVADGGTIQGQITYSGKLPTKMVIPDDRDICGGPHQQPQIMVGPEQGVQDAVVYLPDVPKGKPWPEVETPRLDNRDCVFVPQMLAMPPGPLIIVNSDPNLHNTHIFYGRRTAINVALPKQGMEIERELTRPGILRIECDEHGHMHAAGYVAANPYYSSTGESGEFELTDVPPGEYTLVVYQRTAGQKEQKVTVEAGKTTTVSIDLAS
jgi:hypothetical protein